MKYVWTVDGLKVYLGNIVHKEDYFGTTRSYIVQPDFSLVPLDDKRRWYKPNFQAWQCCAKIPTMETTCK